jgi:two-component system OmpR family sensor kinase
VRLPIRARLTLVSTALMAVVLAAAGTALYASFRADLLAAVDAGLTSRADALLGSTDPAAALGRDGTLTEPDDAFAQVLGPDGRVLAVSGALRSGPLVSRTEIAGLQQPRFFQVVVPTADEPVPARLLAATASGGRVVVVGASLDDQQEALSRLGFLLALGGPVALALAAGVGWLVAGAALRPVERIRAEAGAISASEPGRRLPVPQTGDELARLAETLNAMLARLEEALERERRFVDDASHELRTPLANLRTELELALRRARTSAELKSAARSAAYETERLVRLADDLLVLARADRGRLPVRRQPVEVADLVGSVVEAFTLRAAERGVSLEARVPDGLRASLDPVRVHQALGNLVQNALGYTSAGGRVTVEAALVDGAVALEVADTGEGFPAAFLPQAFEPFSRPDASRSRPDGGAGLGLAIVRGVAEAHGGVAEARNRPEGGASVILRMPA